MREKLRLLLFLFAILRIPFNLVVILYVLFTEKAHGLQESGREMGKDVEDYEYFIEGEISDNTRKFNDFS